MKTFKKLMNEDHDLKGCSDLQLLRKGMVEELKAINLYEKMAGVAKDGRVRDMFMDIAHEEKVHAGEFEALMEKMDSTWEEAEEEAEEELRGKI
jgi:rubrerythrin